VKHRALFFLAVIALIGLGAGVAYAYFTSSGSRSGSGSTGTLQNITVAATTGTPSTPLRPGGSGDVTLQVTNTNSYAVTLVSVTGAGSVTADHGHPGCTTTGVTFASQSSLSISITANGTTQVDLPSAASMSAASSAGCQGATFSIPVTITVQK
jgi:hypothetical protein